jgi:hypothetical protein
MKEKVLLINPPGPKGLFRDTVCSTLSKASYVWKPRGHILFSSIIPAEWDAAFIDASINGLSKEEVINMIREYQPTVLVVALSSVVWDKDYAFISQVRKIFPLVHMIVFGDAIRERYFFDSAMNIADEAILNPLVYNISTYRLKKFSTFSVINDSQIDKKGKEIKTYLPRHKLFDNTAYRWPFVKHFRYAAVYTQFGCPFSCSYCTSSRTSVTYRSADNILDEIDQVYADGYKEIHFGDDTFGSPRENTIKILNGILKKGYRFSWSAYTYPGLVDWEYLKLMHATGCHTLVIGIDSHDFTLLKKYGRPLKQEVLFNFINNCKKLGIDICGDFILGFEEEDEDSILKTIDFAIKSKVDYASFNCANPLFGSSIREQKKEIGIIKEGDFGFDTAGYNIPRTSRISSLRLRELHFLALRRFYFRPGYILRRLFKIRSIEEFMLRAMEGMGVIKNAILTKNSK